MRAAEHGRAARRQGGMTVIEVLIATLIVSLGVLGTLSVHGRAFVGSDSAGYRTQASWLASNLIERARANVDQNYTIALGSATAGSGQAALDLSTWKAQLARALPAGDGSVAVEDVVDPGTGMPVRSVRVTVRWDDRRASGDGATLGDPVYRFVSAETYLPAP